MSQARKYIAYGRSNDVFLISAREWSGDWNRFSRPLCEQKARTFSSALKKARQLAEDYDAQFCESEMRHYFGMNG